MRSMSRWRNIWSPARKRLPSYRIKCNRTQRGGNAMSELVVLAFDDPNKADAVLNRLQQLEKEYLIDLEDAVVAVRDSGGKVRLKQSVNLATTGAATGGLSGAMWGTLVGLLFLNPLAGLVVGGAIGAGS